MGDVKFSVENWLNEIEKNTGKKVVVMSYARTHCVNKKKCGTHTIALNPSRVFFQSFQLFFFYLFVLCGCSCWHNSSVIWQYMKWEMAFIAFNLFNRTLNRFPDFIAQLCKNNKKQRDTQNNNHVYSVVCFVCWISVCKWAVHVPNVSKTL